MTTETIATTSPAPTDPAEATAQPPIPADVVAAVAAHDEASEKARAAEAAFRAVVHPDVWKMHVEVEELWGEARFEGMMLHVEELARHLPGLAPTSRVMWMHVLDERADRVGRCCTDGGPIEP